MSLNTTPVFPKTAILKSLALTTQSACTTRAPTPTASLAAAKTVELLGTGAEMRQIDWIEVVAASSAIGASTSEMLVYEHTQYEEQTRQTGNFAPFPELYNRY